MTFHSMKDIFWGAIPRRDRDLDLDVMLVLTIAVLAVQTCDGPGQAELQVSINFKTQNNTDLSVICLEMDLS